MNIIHPIAIICLCFLIVDRQFNIYVMRFLMLYEQFICNPKSDDVSIDDENTEIEDKKKSIEEAQKEEEEAIARVAAGFLSNDPISEKVTI